MALMICKHCKNMWCGKKKCEPTTCNFRFICLKSAKIDFCPTCQVKMLEEFEKQYRQKFLPKHIRWDKGDKDGR